VVSDALSSAPSRFIDVPAIVDPTKLIAEMSGDAAARDHHIAMDHPEYAIGKTASLSHSATITDADGSRSEASG
jgi:hypothetical protein